MEYRSKLPEFNLENQRVLIRADLNVPLKDNTILNDYRLKALIPTLKLAQEKKAKIIVMTHIGRPKKSESSLSTKLLIPWFESHGFSITFAATPQEAYEKSLIKDNSMVLLENLRFFPGEKAHDLDFAKSLAQLGDYYVNDAFATMHRNDSSITVVPTLFAADKRTLGLLVEKELMMLNKLLAQPKNGFTVILGGGKVADKLPLIEKMLDVAQTILLCPALSYSFAAAQGTNVGKSLVDVSAFDLCKVIIDKAQKKDVQLLLPIDYQVAQGNLQGPLRFIAADEFKNDDVGTSIGPKTIELYSDIIQNSSTIFFNAAMGFAAREETLQGTFKLLEAIAHSKAFSVIGGGDSVSAAQKLGLDSDFDYLSTGGGATLTYLSEEKLPGLEVLID